MTAIGYALSSEFAEGELLPAIRPEALRIAS